VTVVGDLGGAVVALGGAEQLRVRPAPGLWLALREHRRPRLGTGVVALAPIRGLLVEVVDRALVRVEQRFAELRVGRRDLDPGLAGAATATALAALVAALLGIG
jgi:hypothetical protein